MSVKTRCLLVLVFLSILDFSPFPVVGLFALWIVITRPSWFQDLVKELYEE